MRKPVSREAIVETAVDLMLAHGLDAVTLRRIATELGVSAPTLYWHISNKRELLDHVAEHLLLHCRSTYDDAPRRGQPWWEWLGERSRIMYRLMVTIRDAPQVVAGNRPTVESLAAHDKAVGELVAAGFPAHDAQHIFFVLGGYIGGMALEAQAEAARTESGVDDSALHEAVHDAGRFPHLAAAAAGLRGHRQDEAFEYGLDLLIAGIRARHAELTGSALQR